MNINESSLSRFKSNKSGSAKTTSEAKTISDTARIKETSSSSSTGNDLKHLELKEGQVVKGEIIDLRYNKVSIQLESGQPVVTAKLEGDVPLSIGQTAQFLVTEDSSERITLKYLPNEVKASTDTTVDKALTASGLPLTDRNKAIVEELLNHRMSIDKQTLQTLVKISYNNREAAPLTLVLMHKYNIPMTAANIAQFEAYQRGTNSLLTDIHTITGKIFELLKQPYDGQAKDILNINGKLLDILTSRSGTVLNANTPETVLTANMPDTALNNILGKEELSLLSKALGQRMEATNTFTAGVKADLVSQISNGTMTLAEAVKLIGKLYNLTPDMLQRLTDTKEFQILNNGSTAALQQTASQIPALQSGAQVSQSQQPSSQPSSLLLSIAQQSTLQQSTAQPSTLQPSSSQQSALQQSILQQIMQQLSASQNQAELSAAPMITGLLEQLSLIQGDHTELKTVLNPQERTVLLDLLKNFSVSDSRRSQTADGSVSVNDMLDLIKNGLPKQELTVAGSFLQSPEYLKLMKEAFHQKWTITPEQLTKEASVQNLYQHLQEDLEKLSNLFKVSSESMETLRFQEPVKNLQENLSFMKDLNEMFTYLQLPVQLKDKDLHSDLYIFTRKNALKGKKEGLNVLLHLDMLNLGSMNIHIHMDHNLIRAKFYLDDITSIPLISEHLPSLTTALEKKGYSLQAEVGASYEKPDFVKDFIEQSSQDNYTQRYTFDIRT